MPSFLSMAEFTCNRNMGETSTLARFYGRELFTCKRKEVALDRVEWDHTTRGLSESLVLDLINMPYFRGTEGKGKSEQ